MFGNEKIHLLDFNSLGEDGRNYIAFERQLASKVGRGREKEKERERVRKRYSLFFFFLCFFLKKIRYQKIFEHA